MLNKKLLNDSKDFTKWRDELDIFPDPSPPLAYPCVAVWYKFTDETDCTMTGYDYVDKDDFHCS